MEWKVQMTARVQKRNDQNYRKTCLNKSNINLWKWSKIVYISLYNKTPHLKQTTGSDFNHCNDQTLFALHKLCRKMCGLINIHTGYYTQTNNLHFCSLALILNQRFGCKLLSFTGRVSHFEMTDTTFAPLYKWSLFILQLHVALSINVQRKIHLI